MLLSMTGYSRQIVATSQGSFVIELQSINRKYLEINTFLARNLSPLELEIRKILAKRLKRGQVTLRLYQAKGGSKEEIKLPAIDLIKALKKSYDAISAELGTKESLPLTYILNKAEEFGSVEEEFSSKEALFEGIERAVDHLIEMKRAEGHALERDILQRLSEAKTAIEAVEKLAEKSGESTREKLLEKYRALFGEIQDPDRLIKEAFLLAERSDISEEIARLKSHFQQFKKQVDENRESLGKNLEFLIQEMHRETATILAKSSEIEIKTLTLEAKSAIEKIREQVQNVE